MSSEVRNREQADASLESEISALQSVSTEKDASLETKIDADVSGEKSDRIAGDASLEAKLDSDISTEKSSREAADDVEASLRAAADVILQSNINVEKGRIDAILSGASIDLDQFKEIVSFVEDIDLENDNALLAAVNSINTAIADEVNARTAADLAVRTDMTDAILSAKTDVELQISDEVTARQSAVTSLETRHDSEMTAVEADLVAETSSRIAGDATLQASINTLTSDLADEVTDRTEADSSLETKLNADVSTEKAAREAADTSLETKIDSEISTEKLARETADSSIEDKITDIISNTDFTAMDSFSEVTNHLVRLENNHMKQVPYSVASHVHTETLENGGGQRTIVTGLRLNYPNRVKQNTVQVYLNGQLLTEGIDWNEGSQYNDGGNGGNYTTPRVGEAVHAIAFAFEGAAGDTYSVYAVPFEETIDYGGYGGYGY